MWCATVKQVMLGLDDVGMMDVVVVVVGNTRLTFVNGKELQFVISTPSVRYSCAYMLTGGNELLAKKSSLKAVLGKKQ